MQHLSFFKYFPPLFIYLDHTLFQLRHEVRKKVSNSLNSAQKHALMNMYGQYLLGKAISFSEIGERGKLSVESQLMIKDKCTGMFASRLKVTARTLPQTIFCSAESKMCIGQ